MQNQTHNFLLEVWVKWIICCHVFSKYRVSNTNSCMNEQECLYKKIYLLINEGFFLKQIKHLVAIPLKKFIHDIYRILEVSLQNGRFIFLCSTKFSHQIKPLQIQWYLTCINLWLPVVNLICIKSPATWVHFLLFCVS